MNVQILGSSSATPIYDRHPSSQLLTVNDHLYLIDCGEGTLFRLNDFKIKKNKIQAIFISHLHGDHFYGLIGLLTTMSMHERLESLTIVSPSRLRNIIELQCEISKTIIRFPIHYIESETANDKVYEDSNLIVSSFPLCHKIVTNGYIFEQKFSSIKFNKEKIRDLQLTPEEIIQLKSSQSIFRESTQIFLSDVTEPNPKTKRYAYCSDTSFSETYFPFLRNLDTLYHESTFLHQDKVRADSTMHTTALEAGIVAKTVQSQKLLIGHFSARYTNLDPLLIEAQSEFKYTVLALEGSCFEI